MRFPIKRYRNATSLALPDLSGGVNMRDGISEVLDNQLTDCTNMWWYDGTLKTRAGMIQNYKTLLLGDATGNKIPEIKQHNCYDVCENLKGRLCSTVYSGKIFFFWDFGDRIKNIGSVSENPSSYFVCQKSKELYCFTSNRNIYRFADISSENSSWSEVKEDEFYIPKIMVQCNKLKNSTASSEEIDGAVMESYNMINNYYEMSYNSYNPEIVEQEDQKHKMQYHILKNISSYENKNPLLSVTAKFNYNGKEYTHSVTLSESSRQSGKTNVWEEKTPCDDGLLMRVWKNRITFYDESGSIATISSKDDDDYWKKSGDDSEEGKSKPKRPTIITDGEDDIVITAPYIMSNTEKDKIFKMSRCEWFGGSSGLSGGTRLFLCGNAKTENSDLVVWSGLNEPLYFPKNSYFCVGNESGAVTGFGKQGDKLIIFKENEIWFTQYAQNTNITAEDLINKSVIDYISNSVYFPLTQINSNIGCPYPDTVRLCRNRLVWLGNDNNVYVLVSENQYNQRSVFSVSDMVKRKIQELNGGGNLYFSSCDWNGYYCLMFSNTIFLMDYNCYGYNYITSYSKSEDANIKIPWYLWKISTGQKIFTVGNKLCVVDVSENSGKYYMTSYRFETESNKDCYIDGLEYVENDIYSCFKTKVFDFGIPHIRKNIEQLNIQLGNNFGKEISVDMITDCGTETAVISTDGIPTGNYTASYMTSRAVFPSIKQVLKFGMKFESNDTMAVDSIILKYRVTGGTR